LAKVCIGHLLTFLYADIYVVVERELGGNYIMIIKSVMRMEVTEGRYRLDSCVSEVLPPRAPLSICHNTSSNFRKAQVFDTIQLVASADVRHSYWFRFLLPSLLM
jgi:hypothetical protein